MHHLERQIVLNAAPDKVWEFLATPLNLNELTPVELEFRILSELPEAIYNGLLITYQIRIPLFGRRLWVTEIKHVEPGIGFVDEQRIGPYRFWYHRHRIQPLDDGRTRMSDRVVYQLPWGPVGGLVHRLLVKNMLAEIFAYREKRLHELFGAERSRE